MRSNTLAVLGMSATFGALATGSLLSHGYFAERSATAASTQPATPPAPTTNSEKREIDLKPEEMTPQDLRNFEILKAGLAMFDGETIARAASSPGLLATKTFNAENGDRYSLQLVGGSDPTHVGRYVAVLRERQSSTRVFAIERIFPSEEVQSFRRY